MPQDNTQQPSQKMYFDLSGRGGLAPRWFGDEGDTFAQHPEYRYIGSEDQTTATMGESTASDMAAGVWNSSRRYGFMAPANNSFTTITNGTGTPNAREIRATCFDPLTKTAFYADNGSPTPSAGATIWQNSTITSNAWTLNSNFSWPLAGVAISFTDITMYQINGVPYVFASYDNNSSSGDILTMLPGGGATGATATWLSGTASGRFHLQTFDHFFINAPYYLYVVENNLVHRLDGTAATGGASGTALQSVLIASANIIFTDGVSWNGNIYLAATETSPTFQQVSSIFPPDNSTYSSTQCRVYVWDESVTSIGNVQYITISGVKSISKLYVTRAGKFRMISVASNRRLQIREYNGVTFDVIQESSITSMPRYRKSFQQAGDCITWVGADGYIYQHGPIAQGEQDELLVIGSVAGLFTSPATTFMGASIFLDNNSISGNVWNPGSAVVRTGMLISGYDSLAGAAVNSMWYPNQTGNTPYVGNVFTLVKYFPALVKVNYARIYHHVGTQPIPTTVQGTLNIYLNQASASPLPYNITQQDVATGYKYCPINQGAKNAVFAIQAEVNWAVGTTTNDATDWMPRILEIDYTPLEKLK